MRKDAFGWRPLLEGNLASRALDTAEAIVDAITAFPASGATLAAGAAGRALLFAYYGAVRT